MVHSPWVTELKRAARALLQRPGFSLAAVTTLALGIGASVAIFSVADSALLRPLPYPGADRLVRVLMDHQGIGVMGAGVALGDFRDFREESRTLDGLAAYQSRDLDLTGGDDPMTAAAARVSPGLFPVLGVEAALGRTFLPSEEDPAARPAVILSDALWRERFAASPRVRGRTLELDGVDHVVVGVMGPGFRFPSPETRLWVPLALPAAGADRMSHYLGTVGRLPPGATVEQADDELATLASRLADTHAATNDGWEARVVALSAAVSQRSRPAVLVLSGAVALLLLIACANVANLLMIRGAERGREAVIRSALGAPRLRLVNTFLYESLLVALVGGGLGVVLSLWAVKTLVVVQPGVLPAYQEVTVGGRALTVALALAVVAGLLSGLSPALRALKPEISAEMRHGSTSGTGTARLRAALVVGEVALALVLLIGAVLMLQSFQRLGRVDPGFDGEKVLLQRVSLSPERYPGVPRQVSLVEGWVDAARELGAVEAAGAVSSVPLHPAGQNLLPYRRPDGAGGDQRSFAVFTSVTPGAFRALGIPLVSGRDFTRSDDASSAPVVIVDEVLARRLWPGRDAVGRELAASLLGPQETAYRVVGVVGAVRHRDLAEDPEAVIYAPYRQVPPRAMTLVSRTRGDPLEAAEPLAGALRGLDPDQPVQHTTTLEQVLAQGRRQTSLYTLLLGLFAGIGAVLAGVGIYGVIAFTFTQRLREMALRVALGARTASILGLVVGSAVRLALAGIAIGLLAALLGTRWLSGVLYGIGARDPVTFALVPLLLLALAVVAALVPAGRALRVDPSGPLREI